MNEGPMTPAERAAARKAEQHKRQMLHEARAAFTDVAMLDNAKFVNWTRGQMNGVRAAIKRLKLV